MLASVYRHHHGAFPAVFDCPGAAPLDVADDQDRRSSLSGSVGSARPAVVTWGEFWRAPVSKPPFFVVIATFSGTLWALLTVLILDIVVDLSDIASLDVPWWTYVQNRLAPARQDFVRAPAPPFRPFPYIVWG